MQIPRHEPQSLWQQGLHTVPLIGGWFCEPVIHSPGRSPPLGLSAGGWIFASIQSASSLNNTRVMPSFDEQRNSPYHCVGTNLQVANRRE